MGEALAGHSGPGCLEHHWQLVEARLDEGAAYTLYECQRCDEKLRIPPGGAHPAW